MSLKDILARNGITPASQSATSSAGADGTDPGASGASDTEGGSGAGDDPGEQKPPVTESVATELDDATLLAQLQKRNPNIKSLDDIAKPAPPAEPTAEEKAAIELEKKNKARIFALQSGKVTTTKLDEHAAMVAKGTKDIAFLAWKQDYLDGMPEDDKPAEEDLAEIFMNEFHQYAEEDDRNRTRAEKKMQKLADEYLRSNYQEVYELEPEYEQFEQTEALRQSYTSTVEQALTQLGDTLSFSIKDGDATAVINYKLPPEILAEAKAGFTNDDSFNLFGKSKVKPDALVSAIKAGITQKHLDKIIAYVATTHANNKLEEKAKGRRGIPVREEGTSGVPVTKTDNPAMKRQLEKNKELVGKK